MTGLIIIAVAVACVWGMVIYLRGGLLGGCLLVLLAATCFSWDFYVLRLGPAPLTADRVLWIVLLGQYFVWRRRGWAEPKRLGKPELLLLALVGVLTLSTFTHDWQTDGYEPVAGLILRYLMPLGLYWVARNMRLDQRHALWLFGCLGVFGAYLAVVTIAENFEVWWLVWPKYIYTSTSNTKLEFIGRGRGPLLNPIVNGFQIAVCLAAGLMFWPRVKRSARLGLAAYAGLLAFAIACTLTRSAWIGGALALAVVTALTLPGYWRVPLLGGGLIASIVLVAVFWQQLVAFKRDRDLTAQETASSVSLRPILAVVAWNMFQDKPLLGHGFSQYKDVHKNYLADRSTSLILEKGRGYEPHNLLLSILTETGLVGLTLYLALMALWFRDAWRLWQRRDGPLWARQIGLLWLALMAALLPNAMFHDMSLVPMSHLLLFFVSGLVASLQLPSAAAPPQG